ncbi:nuclear transport factor 2 family protein [Pelomonas sp. SE-A7]|nr:nuclear transport factor 2 family protein [Pelomonas sp. SE-A7]MDM4765572.1 nuclear transport factor 2 family protein [Pelomonas sp. SE-A7]
MQAYEAKDLARIEKQFADGIRLADWNLAVQGKAAALEETRKNFESAASLTIEVLAVYEGERRAAAELAITVNGEIRLRVVDALGFDEAGHIVSITAYKGL